MKKLILVLIIFFIQLPVFSQTWIKIYSDDTSQVGVWGMNTFPIRNSVSKQIVIEISNHHFLKYNKNSNSWYRAFSGFLDPGTCYCFTCIPPQTYTMITYTFKVSPLDSQLIIRSIPFGCGFETGEHIDISYNNGATYTNLPQFGNDFIGMANTGFDFDPVSDSIIYIGYPNFSPQGNRIIYKSTDRGVHWVKIGISPLISKPLIINPYRRTQIFTAGQNNLMMSTTSGTVFFPTNGHATISNIAFDPDDSTMFARGNSGLYKSVNGGYNWSLIYSGTDFSTIVISPVNHNILYTSRGDSGLYRSNDGGQTWNLYNDSFFPSKRIIDLSMDAAYGDTVIAATRDAVYKVWGSYVGINPISSEIPETYSLQQNYPNPFNPSTKIKFSIPAAGNGPRTVRVIIYDILGREVTSLVNEQLKPGRYEVEWNAANYPSGVYYYRIVTEQFFETKKMVLIK